MNEDINVTFIIPPECRNENECSEEMQLAFTACEQHSGGGIKAQWQAQTTWKKFVGLTKKDVFVVSEFQGEFFERLRLVGPRCISCCLTEGISIPSGPEPVFTIAMRGLVVTASGLSKQQKENIKKKVHWMGGLYSTVLTEDTTHLVADTVLSDKYVKAVERNLPVMQDTWIEAVWESSLRLNINAASSDFDNHKLPPFANLQVTTTGITKKDKALVMKLVSENGGTFSGAFQSETTDIVVLNKDSIGSEKYKAALEYGKACVLPSWVIDSAARGVALPLSKYRVAGASTSSPLSEHRAPDMSLNFSRITNLRPPSNFVDESRAVDISTMSSRMKFSQETKKSNETSTEKEMLSHFEKLDMTTIKKAGPIFDGFCIWLTGVEGPARDRAAACISRCGGVRYDCPHERVTHALAGTAAAAVSASAALPSVPVLQPLWLVKSVLAGRPLGEAEFLINTKPATPVKARTKVEAASPMSKRNMQLLRHGPLDLPPPTPEVEEPPDEIVHHYLSQRQEQEKTPERVMPAEPEQPDVTDDLDEPSEDIEQIFKGITIQVRGLDEEAITEIAAEVSAAGGVLVAGGVAMGGAMGGSGAGSYVLVPLEWDGDTDGDGELVTVFWIKDCLSQQELLEIQYYHRPVKLPQWTVAPLEGVVASLSTYSGFERAFLDELAKLLGATTQLRFCRRNTANALASTHLICPTASGDKYQGAVKWGLPAVTADWLLDCATTGTRTRETKYLVGETKEFFNQNFTAPPSPEHQREEQEKPRDDTSVENKHTDKENAMLPPDAAPRRGSIPEQIIKAEVQVRTPQLDDALSTPNLMGLSPTTRRRLQAVRRGEMPSDPIRTPTDPFPRVPCTPDSSFCAGVAGGRLSPGARKTLWSLVDRLPSGTPAAARSHTPLSEIRNRFLSQFNDSPTDGGVTNNTVPRKLHLNEQVETPPSKMAKTFENQSAGGMNISEENDSSKSAVSATTVETPKSTTLPPVVDAQLQRLSAVLASRLSSQRKRTRDSVPSHNSDPPPPQDSEPAPESQPNTVGWDDTSRKTEHTNKQTVKKFMLSSNVDNREEIAAMIQCLGGEVSDSPELDLFATHLLCAAPGRSEKMLGSVAAGKWILHPAYISRSRAAGRFLEEEEYEWGNPKASCLPSLTGAEKSLAQAAHRWRAARKAGGRGPFDGMRAVLHVPAARKRLLARLLEAGDGIALDDEPPYSEVNVTVCFADLKRYPLSERDSSWFISRGTPVCPPVLLSSYLTEDTPPDPLQHCFPNFRP
ncbi:unnamed protein product [Danaus chrysippus]|uniref:(African queen) hypothetical protein n=1 Tax=Danaus chrysippus TaxID=151541 RepID=A0A8J2R2X5_9NEOP|nr:unnamed protein product [Danaus chrysippus]